MSDVESIKPEVSHDELADLRKEVEATADLNNPDASLQKLLARHPVSEFSKTRIKLYVLCVCLYLCPTMNGYDGSLATSISTLPSFLDYFNLHNSPASTGLFFAIYPIAAMASTPFIPLLCDGIGRVKTIIIGLSILCVGAIVSATVKTLNLLIFARFLLSFGANIASSAAPMLLMETLPPNRKSMGLFFNTFYYVGSIVCTWASYGTSIAYDDEKQFKIPLWLQLLCPGICLLFVWMYPESPRYLYSKNRIDDCRQFLIKYHAGGDPNHPIVLAELNQIAQSFEVSGLLKPRDYFDFSGFLRTRSRRHRSLLVVVWSWFNQFSGNQVISYYMTTLFLNLGIKNATTRLLLTAVNSIICFLFASAGAFAMERIGRRPALLYANTGFIISFIALAVSTKKFDDDNDNKQAAAAGIAFIYIFQAVFFSFAMTPLQPTYPSEILSNDMRARGMAMYMFISNAASTLNLYTAPLAMQNITYWYYVFYVFWDTFQLVVVYFLFVETSNLTLEEIEHVFDTSNAVKESVRLSKKAKSSKKGGYADEENVKEDVKEDAKEEVGV
ncbi:hypothetical protein PSN45_002727 [Yamadazyma tenuis]|uniref:Major facilitator superfamily (MFS) profile domain-containing protein n=1 Tax=Candida tenuis (strain ATCC 10573 / BCRC 21748 / CBS 615 / JCM 9827 / NBRC 10315 / NRRL Y-1498 / VKM Y-70) TaxID=590646 RepID=G3AX07_CANTC|nr:uncharacterized protein CANTEDRAFT_117814 [Yamadazyma tenuis ATCC 10573]EGV66656.1 hypothetical protein CANTEDRAFT_117814 [Yamadazyma tenuis ATCC 10573]WEJ95214.1 hypothetical protein PSN45_002727 [Yamadazyma tenuis]